MKEMTIINQIGNDVTVKIEGVFFTFPICFGNRLTETLRKIREEHGNIAEMDPKELIILLQNKTGLNFGTSYDDKMTLVILPRIT